MDFLEAKDIDISLHTSLLALAFQRDLGIPISNDWSSSITSFSAVGQRFSPPPRSTSDPSIALKVAYWAQLAETPTMTPDEGRERVCKIFTFFLATATDFGLEDTPCTRMLEEAIMTCTNSAGISPQPSGRDKITQRTGRKVESQVVTLQGYVLQIPVFNIFKAMCWIYSCCVDSDKIRTDREAELYLLQFRFIFKALWASGWVPRRFMPSTVAAAWNSPTGAPLLLVFSCSGVGMEENDRLEINAARVEYVRGLHTLADICADSAALPNRSRNDPGNCPEFICWGSVCRGEGTYRSLCLNVHRNVAYQCCTHCDFLAKAALECNRIEIEDWYYQSSLTKGVSKKFGHYYGRDLKDLKDILDQRRGRKVWKRQ